MAKNIEKEEKNEMSIEMLKACKNEIAKFGFNLDDYTKFLVSVNAMKDSQTVLQYPNHDIEKYREMFLKKNEHSIEDSMQLDKFKIKTSYYEGEKVVQKETGYFAPRSFWDKIYKIKLKDY